MKYRIKNWCDFQHYKDRMPPWIKLHNSLLTSEVWVMSNDSCRALIVACMLLASRNEANDGTFNGDPEYVKRFAYLHSKPDFNPLIQYGFIEPLQDASAVLAECNTEERREEENRDRAEKKATATRLPTDWQPDHAYLSFCSSERPDLDPHKVADSFRDYWLGAPGAKGRKQDWMATWRNWVRNQRQERPQTLNYMDDRKNTLDQLTGRNRHGQHTEIDITAESTRVTGFLD